jgi:signal transduction histidine kinase
MTLERQQEGFQKLQNAFLLLASHEIKTPLTAIRGYSELLLRKRDKIAPNTNYQNWITSIYQESLRLSEYIQKLLAQNQHEIAYDFDFIDTEKFLKEQFSEKKYPLKIQADDDFHVFASVHSLISVFNQIFKLINQTTTTPILIVLKSRNSYHSIEIISHPDFEPKHLFEKKFEEIRKELFLQYGLLSMDFQKNKLSFQMRFPKIQLSN